MGELFLTQAEVDDLCSPLKQAYAQVRFLRGLGLTVTVKPNGRPAVVRTHAESVLSGQRPAASIPVGKPEAPAFRPNVEGFMKLVRGGRRKK